MQCSIYKIHTNTYVDRVSNFAAENVFNKALFCSTMNVTKSATINDKGSYKICWKSLLKTMKSTMNPTNNDKEFLKESFFVGFHNEFDNGYSRC